MPDGLKLMCILAHPDDESLGMGGILARYADEGIETYLLTATRGEQGWFGDPQQYPGPEALGNIREQELASAAEVLGLQQNWLLDYPDGQLDQADPAEAIGSIARHLRRVQPHVVVTFDPYGAYGHPDHIAICQFTAAAIVAAASPSFDCDAPPHQVSKLYYLVGTQENLETYQKAFGELMMVIDGEERRAPGWQSWAITTRVNTEAYWRQIWKAVECHRSQLPEYQALQELPEEARRTLWAVQSFYRAFSLVNGGRRVEKDLFEGLR